jgi:hypothetical protein
VHQRTSAETKVARREAYIKARAAFLITGEPIEEKDELETSSDESTNMNDYGNPTFKDSFGFTQGVGSSTSGYNMSHRT